MKTKYLSKLIVITFITMSSLYIVSASNTSVLFEISPSKVANLYYQVLENGNPIKQDVTFELIDSNGQTILFPTTNDGILFIENVPFDDYILKYNETKKFPIQVDSEYLKTQHLLKTIDIGILSQKTDDNASLIFYCGLFCLSGLLLQTRKRVEFQ